MAPKQSTLGAFFKQANGASSKAPTQQSTLSFSSKTKTNLKDTEEDGDDKPVAKRQRRQRKVIEEEEEEEEEEGDEDVKMEDGPKSPVKEKKTKKEVKEEEEEDAPAKTSSPVRKRGRPPKSPDARTSRESSPIRPKREDGAAAANVEDAPAKPKKKKASDVESESEPSESEVEKKPAAKKAKANSRAKMQSALISGAKVSNTYPDWNAGDPVPYAALCTTFSLIEQTRGRLAIMEHCSLFLRQVLRLTPDDLPSTIQLMINKLAPDYAGIELGIGESLIIKAIGEVTGRSAAVVKDDQKKIGDLGLVAVKSKSTQQSLRKPKPLTIRGVHKSLMHIALMSGTGAQGKKVDAIKTLLASADAHSTTKVDITKDKGGPSEAKFIVRFLEGKLRLGLADKTVLPSLAQAVVAYEAEAKGVVPSADDFDKGESILKTVYSELPSYEIIIRAMLADGIANLRNSCKLQPGVPLKPMLAKPTKAITEVLDRFENKTFTCEYKYDGERAQIHYVAKDATDGSPSTDGKGVTSIFSRNSEDLSTKYPDVLGKLKTWVAEGTTSFVLDCETVGWDAVEKKVLPFQQLMTRKRKDVKVEDVKVKVIVFAFDLLYLNGQPVVSKSLRERRELLHKAFVPVTEEFAFATHMNSREIDDIQTFLDESVKASCEGLMVKMLDGPESGYEPSERSRNWLKVKKDYLAGVGDSLDLVVLGAYYGKGKRTSVYGAFLLACYNPKTEIYETICNIGTGFSEQVLEELHSELSEHVIDRPKPFYSHTTVAQYQPDVWFEPRQVWEVRTADLTLSPRYKAGQKEVGGGSGGSGGDQSKGISLRFPRFIKIRDDKKPDEATSSRQVAEMYWKQESVSQAKKGVDDDFEY